VNFGAEVGTILLLITMVQQYHLVVVVRDQEIVVLVQVIISGNCSSRSSSDALIGDNRNWVSVASLNLTVPSATAIIAIYFTVSEANNKCIHGHSLFLFFMFSNV